MTNIKENCMSTRYVLNVPYEGSTVYMNALNASDIRNEKYVFPIDKNILGQVGKILSHSVIH
jgi:hypothetical protein